MNKATLTFIGAGNMTFSIIGGLVAKGYPPGNIIASDPARENLEKLNSSYGVATTNDNAEAVSRADVIVLAVKPQVMKSVATALRPHLEHAPLIISIAAGISMDSLNTWLGQELAIVRCMPNTPALVQTGASALFANANTSTAQRQIAEEILAAVGIVSWLDSEGLIDTVIAVSGSGPAYFFLLMEAMIEVATQQGLKRETAVDLTLQTALGAARLAQDSGEDVAELRRRVMSPGGTTEKAVQSFENDDFRTIVARAMHTCADRSAEMAREMGE